MSKYCLTLPKEIGDLTLNEILSRSTATISSKNDALQVFWEEDGENYAFKLWAVKHCENSEKRMKKDYLDDILRLKKNGWTQKRIARELGISEPYVSQLLSA